jgi:glycosyltransferase involved in cell wall biosynthesis
MFKNIFDYIIVATESDLVTEPRANRFNWIRQFVNQGFEVIVIQPKPSGPSIISGLEGAKFVYGGTSAFESNLLKEILHSGKKILFWNYGSMYVDSIPRENVFLVHHATEDYFNSSFPWAGNPDHYLGNLSRLVAKAHLVVAVSEGVARNLRTVISDPEKISVIENAVDLNLFHFHINDNRNDKVIVYQGAINDRIDWPLVTEVAIKNPKHTFSFYGVLQLSQRQISELPSNVVFHGQIDPDNLRKVMASAFAGIIPFKQDNWLVGSFPLKFLEYQACGLPVFTSQIDSLKRFDGGIFEFDVLLNGVDGFKFSEIERQAIANNCLTETYEIRFQRFFEILEKKFEGVVKENILGISSRPRIVVIYDEYSLHVETIREHLIGFYTLNEFEVFFLSSRCSIFGTFSQFDILLIHYSVRIAYPGHLTSEMSSEIENFKGLKILVIQDEYDRTGFAISEIKKVGIDLIFTCVPESRLTEIYPELVDLGIRFKQVLTGFAFMPNEKEQYIKDLSQRDWDIGYRGRKLSHRYGKLGYEKWRIGELVEGALNDTSIRLNISSRESDRVYGKDWFQFLGNCIAVLGTESGSNIFDHDGQLEILSQAKAEMSYDAFERLHLQGLEIDGLMNQISPRIFEAISTKTALILFPGSYSDVIEPWRNYFPLQKDLSNLEALLSFLNNHNEVERMIENTYEDVVISEKYNRQKYYKIISKEISKVYESKELNSQENVIPVDFIFKKFPSNFKEDRGLYTQNNSSPWNSSVMRFVLHSRWSPLFKKIWHLIPSNHRYKIITLVNLLYKLLMKIK